LANTQPMRIYSARCFWLSLSLGVCLWSAAPGADDRPQTSVEVHEWSIWVGNPAQTTLNGTRVYNNSMPTSVGTSRPKFEEKDVASKFPIAPISVVQFFGDPDRDVDIDLKVKKGAFLAHWPPSAERGGRLQWFKSDVTKTPPAGIPQSYLPESHWLRKLRETDSALYLKNESRFERFVAYDTEVGVPVPVKLRGGPDEYTLQNLTDRRLLDVAVIAPTENGYRVGWLDELPAATPDKPEDPKKKKADPAKTKTDSQKADAVFQEADTKATKDEDIPKLPAEGDANVRARVDQILNRQVNVNVEQAPRKEVLDLIASQARFRYELDTRTIAKADINLGQTMSLKAGGVAARDALADVLGSLGLSYRVTEDGTLFITTAARLADEAGKKGSVIEGPSVKLTLSQPLKASDPSYHEHTRDAYTRRLAGRGMRQEQVQFLLAQHGKAIFEPGELIVLAHFSREAIDEAVLLDVFPPPKKFVRTALLVIHGIDPRLQDRARTLVQQLGDASPKARESAESRLFELGPVAVPVLEDALTNKDIEIVFRAERLLLRLNRPVP
jgi:hypothetical protein